MSLRIVFTQGSRKGSTAALKPGSEIGFGRSRKSAVKLEEPDVSGHHIAVRTSANGSVVMQVLSEHRTTKNGSVLQPGSSVPLAAGDTVELGGSVTFKVETYTPPSADDAPTGQDDDERTMMAPMESDGDGETVVGGTVADDGRTATFATQFVSANEAAEAGDDAGETIGGGGETVFMQTRIGSDEEIEEIKRGYKQRSRRRTLGWLIPMLMLFIGLAVAYVMLKPEPEQYTSWPVNESGKSLTAFELVEPYLAVAYPDIPETSSISTPNGKRFSSALGKFRDIPLFIETFKRQDKALLKMDHAQAFETYLARRRESDTSLTPGANRIRRFMSVTSGAGVPVSFIDYTRRQDADEYFGFLVYLRRADFEYAISIEVPLMAQWRAEKFLRYNLGNIVKYAAKRVPEHWEGGTWFREKSKIATDLSEAKSFLARKAPINWEASLFRIKSALIKGAAADDVDSVREATDLLVKLREEQSVWYNQQKLAYLQAEVIDDKENMQSINATCESIFTPAFQDCDYRYERIKRKDWK